MNGWWLRAAVGLLQVLVAVAVASVAIAAIYYLLPGLHLWRGMAALTTILAGLGVLALQPVLNLRRRR